MSTNTNILKVGQIRAWKVENWEDYGRPFIIQSISSTSCNLFEFASGNPPFTMIVYWVKNQSTLLSDVED